MMRILALMCSLSAIVGCGRISFPAADSGSVDVGVDASMDTGADVRPDSNPVEAGADTEPLLLDAGMDSDPADAGTDSAASDAPPADTAPADAPLDTAPPPTTVTLGFEFDYVDLDTGLIERSVMAFPPPGPSWDLKIAYNATRPVRSVVFQNQTNAVEIVHLPGRTFDSVTAADAAGASFTLNLIDVSFDAGRVILIRTDAGAVFKLGNPVETDPVSLQFDYAPL